MNEKGTKTFSSQTTVQCGKCGETSDVEWFCVSCETSLCTDCQNFHKLTARFRNHVVFPRTFEVLRLHGPAKIAEICKVHPTKELSTYCSQCETPCCVLCQADHHQHHECLPLEEVYLSTEKNLNEYARNLEENIKPSLHESKERVVQNLEELEVQIEGVKFEINLFRCKLIQAVEESCDLLLKELDDTKNDFREIERNLDSAKERLDELIKEVKFKICEGKLDLINYSPPPPSSLIPDLILPNTESPNFIPNNDIIGVIKGDIGKIEVVEKITHMDDESEYEGKSFDKSKICVRMLKSLSCNYIDSSIKCTGRKSAWVVDSSEERLLLYDSSGELLKSISLNEATGGINDVAVAKSGDLIITCGDMKVRHVTKEGSVTLLTDTTPFEPDGICLTDTEDIVVCMKGKDFGKHIAVFSHEGHDKLQEISGRDSQGRRTVTDPYRVVNNGSDLCVVNKGRNVVCFDRNYDVKWMYNGREAKIGSLFSPRCLCVDKHQNFLITDNNNHCVHYIDRDGGLIQLIMTQDQTKLWDPLGICVDDDTGQVWLGNYSGDVVIAEYLK